MIDRSPQARFAAAERIRVFLRDEVVQEILKDMEQENAALFMAAETDEARRNSWAEARTLARFSARLGGVLEDGKAAESEIAAENKRHSPPPAR